MGLKERVDALEKKTSAGENEIVIALTVKPGGCGHLHDCDCHGTPKKYEQVFRYEQRNKPENKRAYPVTLRFFDMVEQKES